MYVLVYIMQLSRLRINYQEGSRIGFYLQCIDMSKFEFTKYFCMYQTARNAQVAARLSCRLVTLLSSIRYKDALIRIACSGLMITSLLQVVNRLDAS